ncbi:MAG: proteasome subunit alpha, partial [archaeon]
YQEGMDMEDAAILGLKALKKATEEEKLNPKAVEIGVVRRTESFRRLTEDEVDKLIQKVNSA